MTTFLKYFGLFCLGLITAAIAATAVILYQGVSTMSRYLQGIDDYTCHQFLYDMTHEGTAKMVPLLFSSIAYGDAVGAEQTRNAFGDAGIEPAVRKGIELCRNAPQAKLLDAFASSIVNGAGGVSPSTPVSPTE